MTTDMRILGLDIGSKSTGIAVSDGLGITAQGLATITGKTDREIREELKRIIKERGIKEIVIGLPLNMNGTKGPKADEVIKFTEALRAEIRTPVKLWDERLTTMETERVLLKSDVSRARRKKVKDVLAAQLILQSYLDYKGVKHV